MKIIRKEVWLATVPVLGLVAIAYSQPTVTKKTTVTTTTKTVIKPSGSTVKVKAGSPRDSKFVTSDKIRIDAPATSGIKKLKPVLRITYPPNNIWVKRGTRIIMNGTSTDGNYLVVDARYAGTVYTHRRVPGTKTWIKDKVGKPFSNREFWNYNSFSPDYENGTYKWSFSSIDTNDWGRSLDDWQTEFIPNKVLLTVRKSRKGVVNLNNPEDSSQTISVDIRD